MTTENDNNKTDVLLNSVSKHLGVDKENIKNAAQNGNLQNILKNMNSTDAAKIQKVLSDKDAAKKLLSTPQAQLLLKKFLGDK